MTQKDIDSLSATEVDNEIAKLIGWTKIRKKNNSGVYNGINPNNNIRENIPCFSKCTEAIHVAENYVAQLVGITYIVYLGQIISPNKPASWENIQQAFLEPQTRAKACLAALRDITNKTQNQHVFMI